MKRSGLPTYVTGFSDRHGKRRYRARRHGLTYYFAAKPGTDEFALEYQRWLAGVPRPEVGASRTRPGSVDAVVVKFYRSAEWAGLSPSTKATYRGIIERFRADHGTKPVALLERRHVRDMVAAKAATPAAANNLLRIVRMLMRFAIEEGWRKDDPTLGVKPIRIRTEGFHTWSEAEISAFEGRWPVGTPQRLAFDLLLFTAQRRSDVVRMGRQHMRNGRLDVHQQKTGTRLAIPIHFALTASIDAAPADNLTFLVTSFGKPFTPAGFGNWFREACDAAGLPKGCSAHGLRKAACRRLAEAGCSANQIAAISGHATLREVSRYTRAADQERLAGAAMQAIGGAESEHKVANHHNRLAKSGDNSLKTKDA
jgi:integrase